MTRTPAPHPSQPSRVARLVGAGAAAVLAALAFAGCAPEDDGLPVEPWVELINGNRVELIVWQSHWADADCTAERYADEACAALLTDGVLALQQFEVSTVLASEPTDEAYIGPIPDRIQQLWLETTAQSQRTSLAGSRWRDDCRLGPTTAGCDETAASFLAEIDELSTRLDGWYRVS